jgi:hypothetical protein
MAVPNTGIASEAWRDIECWVKLSAASQTPRAAGVLNGTAKPLLCGYARS